MKDTRNQKQKATKPVFKENERGYKVALFAATNNIIEC